MRRCDQQPDLAVQHALVHRHLLHLADHLGLGILGSIHSDANWEVSYIYYWSDNDDLTFLMILEVFQVDVYFCILPTNCKHRQSFSFMKNISISLLLLPSRDGVEVSPWVHGIKFRPRAIRIMHCILHSNCEHFKLFQTQATGDPFINSLFANIINVCTEYCIACILRSVPGTMHSVTLTCHVVMCHDMSRYVTS